MSQPIDIDDGIDCSNAVVPVPGNPWQTADMSDLPAGTVTFLLTDIENSSTHWEDAAEEMRAALTAHDAIVSEQVEAHDGHMVKHLGDGAWGSFSSAPRAAEAAIAIQRLFQQQPEVIRARLRVRIGLHTGDVTPTDNDYFGPVPNRMARVADLANGDQIVCSSACAGLLSDLDLATQGDHELRGIGVDEIFLLKHPDLITDPRPLRRPVMPLNLPRIRTSFLGRDADLLRAIEFLQADHAVVTLLGPGGVGKTRLAIEVGAEVSRLERTNVVFCDLASVRESEDVAPAIADVVGARQQPGMDLLESIADYVRDRQVILILDNCEQVVQVIGELVARLATADGVKVLATSRAALHARGEQLLDVEPLAPEHAGLDLFVSRAREHDPSFELDDQSRELVREITQRLDGIPLAIELAAARIRLMSPAELVAGLDNRFGLLNTSKQRGRHETLHETVMWSFQLLTEQEAAVFVRMSVFAGGASLAAIADVCADGDLVTADQVPDIVLSLVEQSMVVGRTRDGHRRFRLLETMRGFGEGELADDEKAVLQRRHADYFRSLATKEQGRLFSAAEPDVWRVLDSEWANLRIALDAYVYTNDLDGAAEIVVSLVHYATLAMRFELFSWAEELLSLPGIETHRRYVDLSGAAALGAYFTVSGRVTELAEAGLAADSADPEGWCRTALAAVFLNNVHTEEASDALTSAWLASEPPTVAGRIWAEGFRTFHLCTHGFPAEASPHAIATTQAARSTGSLSALALGAWAQGMVVSYSNLRDAIKIWNDGLEGPRSMPRDHLMEHLLVGLILHFTVEQESVRMALEHCRTALSSALDSHYYAGTSHLFGVAAIALCRGGDPETGAQLVGSMIGNGHLPRANATEALHAALGDDVKRHETLGMMLSVTQAGHLALETLDAAIASYSAPAPNAESIDG